MQSCLGSMGGGTGKHKAKVREPWWWSLSWLNGCLLSGLGEGWVHNNFRRLPNWLWKIWKLPKRGEWGPVGWSNCHHWGAKANSVVTCTGTWCSSLGITLSRSLMFLFIWLDMQNQCYRRCSYLMRLLPSCSISTRHGSRISSALKIFNFNSGMNGLQVAGCYMGGIQLWQFHWLFMVMLFL